ncbi:hypothetical protein LTR84_008936 [Exophiala bonariae]|uniref:Uncharacterized protein n=1 Tax=Exophiala bonariae TaxID=1690606 RepID=A0AAV9MWC4_9EURO|nr:hypothetical protein LTR84_008936 [Exophiala bonariae]
MSGRRHSDSYNSHSSDPIVLERDPQVRNSYRIIRPTKVKKSRLTIGSKIYNLFRTRRRKVQIVEESPIRSRRQQRRIRTPSPSPSPSPPPPPSPPRGPYRRMTTRLNEDDIYAPLPPKMSPKSNTKHRKSKSDDYDAIYEEREPQLYRKVKVVHTNRRDEDAHPRVEIPSSSHKRHDSGKYYVETRVHDRPSSVRSDFDHRREDDGELRQLTNDLSNLLAKERKDRIEAERATAIAEAKANRLEADLAHEQRQRSLEKRERAAADRERRLTDERHSNERERERERDRIVEVRRPVVVHNPIVAVAPLHENNHRSALDRAQADYQQLEVRENRGFREEARPSTAERRPRRQSIVIVEPPREPRNTRHGHR